MYASKGAAERARWQVLWVKDRRVISKEFGTDLAEATRIYALAVAGGRKNVTLRCKNVAFPPPDKFADKEEVVVIRGDKKYRGRKPVEPRRYMQEMMGLNRRGVWWCCYCMKMRKFVKRKGYMLDGVWVDDVHLACPMCGASHRVVAQYNPLAYQLSARVKDPNRRSKRARRRRRQREEEDDE